MLTGSCRTSPSMCAVGEPLHEGVGRVEADEPHLARPAVVLQHAQHRQRRRLVRAEDAVDAEAAVGLLVAAEQRLALLVRAFDVGAAVLIGADDLDARVARRSPRGSLPRAGSCCRTLRRSAAARPCRVAQQARELLARQASALAVVGRDEADVVVALQPRVDDDDRDSAALRVGHRLSERRVVERRQHDARDAAADEPLDFGDLRIAIVLAQRPAPDDRHAELAAPPFPRPRGCSARTRATCLSG